MDAYALAMVVTTLIYVLLCLGLNFQYGFTGLINFGYVGFFAVGAYAAGLTTVELNWHPVAGFALAAVIPALLAWPIGLVALRLREDYFAIVTLGFSETVRLFLINERSWTHGNQGISGVPPLFGALTPYWNDAATGACLLVACIVVGLGLRKITRSPYGRLIQAIRDDETALLAIGKNPARYKTQVLMAGGAIAGIAGAFYAHYTRFITPEQYLPGVTFYVWMAIIMGGVGRLLGSVAGAVLLMVFLEGSRVIRDIFPGVTEVLMSDIRLAAVGIGLTLFIRFKPQGFFGVNHG